MNGCCRQIGQHPPCDIYKTQPRPISQSTTIEMQYARPSPSIGYYYWIRVLFTIMSHIACSLGIAGDSTESETEDSYRRPATVHPEAKPVQPSASNFAACVLKVSMAMNWIAGPTLILATPISASSFTVRSPLPSVIFKDTFKRPSNALV